jgi:hypothetical protein
VLAEAERDAERLRAKAVAVRGDAGGEAERIRGAADRIGESDDRFRHEAHRIRPDASPLDTDDEITAYAREERWHPGSAPHA